MGKDPQDIIKRQQKTRSRKMCRTPCVHMHTGAHAKGRGLGGFMEAHTRNQEEGGWD